MDEGYTLGLLRCSWCVTLGNDDIELVLALLNRGDEVCMNGLVAVKKKCE